MRIHFDNCRFNRPFDDQVQKSMRTELYRNGEFDPTIIYPPDELLEVDYDNE